MNVVLILGFEPAICVTNAEDHFVTVTLSCPSHSLFWVVNIPDPCFAHTFYMHFHFKSYRIFFILHVFNPLAFCETSKKKKCAGIKVRFKQIIYERTLIPRFQVCGQSKNGFLRSENVCRLCVVQGMRRRRRRRSPN